jgi:predicted metal-dependent peptidase
LTYKFEEGGSASSGMGGGDSPESDNQNARDGYGQNGHNGVESYSLEGVFDKLEKDQNGGEFFDSHMKDEVPEELREQMVKDLKERLRQRGLVRGDMESLLNDLQKKKKDYTKEIKRGISMIKGTIKEKTIKRLPRRGIEGLKGKIKYGSVINVMLDTSGSMNGYETKALEYCFRNDIAINLIQCDTEVHAVEKIKTMKELQKVRIKGGGGTVLQPGIDYMKEHFPLYGMMVLTDGYCDSLDFSGYKGKVLIISNAVDVPVSRSNGKVKSIVIENFEY